MFRRTVALVLMLLISGGAMAQIPSATGTPQPLAPLPVGPQPSEQQAPAPQAPMPQSAAPQSPATQTGEAPSGRVFCEQNVDFQLADPATIPRRYRRFLGVWSDAAWDAHTCAALIVRDIKADGTASIIYVFGPQGPSSPVPGGVLNGTGVIRGGQLRFQNTDGSQFAFQPGIVDMTGHMINPKGESFESKFMQTP